MEDQNQTNIITGTHREITAKPRFEDYLTTYFGVIVDEENSRLIRQLYYYFYSIPKFEGDLNKGILLLGNIGTGKSFMMKVFQKVIGCHPHLQYQQYQIITHRQINRAFVQSGYYGIEGFSYSSGNRHLTIDELIEPTQHFNYSEPAIPIFEVLLDRYDLFSSEGIKTHLTSNLSVEQLETAYPDRIYSRFKDMFNILTLTGCDRRGSCLNKTIS